jgi:hypothetical protein
MLLFLLGWDSFYVCLVLAFPRLCELGMRLTRTMMTDAVTMLRCRVFEGCTIDQYTFISISLTFRFCPARLGNMLHHFGKLLPYLINFHFPVSPTLPTCISAIYGRSYMTWIHCFAYVYASGRSTGPQSGSPHEGMLVSACRSLDYSVGPYLL